MSEEIKEENVTTEEVTKPDTHEYVIIGGKNYKTESIETRTDSIVLVLADMAIADAVEKFSEVTELQVSDSTLRPYGSYENLVFVSALVDVDTNVTVTMKKKNDLEVEVEQLQQAVNEQAVAIADILYGGGEA